MPRLGLERRVAGWNSIAGIEPVKSFKTSKAAASRIWERIQSLAQVPPVVAPAEPKADTNAKLSARVAKDASGKSKANQRATAAKSALKGKTAAFKVQEPTAPREGSKIAQVVAMLQRKRRHAAWGC